MSAEVELTARDFEWLLLHGHPVGVEVELTEEYGFIDMADTGPCTCHLCLDPYESKYGLMVTATMAACLVKEDRSYADGPLPPRVDRRKNVEKTRDRQRAKKKWLMGESA